MEKIILASSSPRRRELMAQAGFAFEVLVSEADETIETETPGEMVEVLSERKAAAVAEEIKKQGFAGEQDVLRRDGRFFLSSDKGRDPVIHSYR